MMLNRPRFCELPILQGLGLRSAWGVYGPDDNLGSVNLLTAERVRAACGLVRTGRVVNVTAPVDLIDPPLYGREPMQHSIFEIDRNSLDDRLDGFYLQSSSQWDGLRHIRAREYGFWGGPREPAELTAAHGPLGIEHWAEHGLIGRGVLLDVARHIGRLDEAYAPTVARSVGPQLLSEAAASQGVEIRQGDIICVRFGWMDRFLAADAEERRRMCTSGEFAGLAADESMAEWLWDEQIAAIACDNPAAEVSPGDRAVGSLHRRIVPMLGQALGELFDFSGLATTCARDRAWEFMFVSVPLNLPGGVGTPANAVAIL